MLWFGRQPRSASSSGCSGASSPWPPVTRSRRVLIEPLRAYLTTRALGIPLWRFVSSLVRRRAGDRADGRIAARRPLGLVEAGSPAWLRLVLLIVLGGVVYVAELPVARSRGHAGDQGRDRPAERAGSASSAGRRAVEPDRIRAGNACSSRSARADGPKRWPNGHVAAARLPPTMKSCSTKLHIAQNGPASCAHAP